VTTLSVNLQNYAVDNPGNWRFLLERAEAADAAGIDRLVVSDHVVFGEDLEAYSSAQNGGRKGGRQPTGPDGYWLEPLTLLAAIASRTSRVRLGTSILLAALRRPVVLSKTLATLDALSEGRIDLGVGVGWQKEEYEAVGLAFKGRGKLLDHTLAVLQAIWSQERSSFSDQFLEFDAIHSMPKPSQPGGIPIWVSGTANANVARRIARFGSGWIPWGPAADNVVQGIAQMRELVEAAGGSFDGTKVVGTVATVKDVSGAVNHAATLEPVPRLVEAGVTDIRVQVDTPADSSAAFDAYSAFVTAFRSV
jgi:probable F420-dependent oxidoreductase